MQIDHVHFFVDQASTWRDWFARVMNFQWLTSVSDRHTQTEVMFTVHPPCDPVIFVFSSPRSSASPVADYLQRHPPGVADLAFAVEDLDMIAHQALANGIPWSEPIQEQRSPQGVLRWCQITGPTTLRHTLLERKGAPWQLPQWLQVSDCGETDAAAITHPSKPGYFVGIDHVVLNVIAGEMEAILQWYESVLGFERQQTFLIQSHYSGLYSQVLKHPTSQFKFPVNEPRSTNSQVQEFLDINRGSGIQHLALHALQITQTTECLRKAGLRFLDIPKSYYTQPPPLNLSPQEWQAIATQQILVDGERDTLPSDTLKPQNHPLLLQIFTQPIFAQPTFFLEFIERRWQAQGFGEGNFQALFEAIEREQLKRGGLAGC